MKHLLFIMLTFCSSAYSADTLTWCSSNLNPLTEKPSCITYTPGIAGIGSSDCERQ